MSQTIRIGVLGASGYAGADLVRLALRHPAVTIEVLTADTHAGKPMADVFPHLSVVNLPDLVRAGEADWSTVDAIFCGLPHGAAQDIIAPLLSQHPALKVVDMSADFRISDPAVYSQWYGRPHGATSLLGEAAYGLTEHNRDKIAAARLVACPGCYPTAALLGLTPLVAEAAIDVDDIVVDAKSGVTGAGRGLKQSTLFSEAGEGLAPYAVASHRHAPEIEQELGKRAGRGVIVSFTPHLVPMSRGELCTAYVRMKGASTVDDLRALLIEAYRKEPFVQVVASGDVPKTQNVRGSNYVQIGVFADRIPGRAIIISVLDNLVKGSAGQAIQNFNLMFGQDETQGLLQLPLFP